VEITDVDLHCVSGHEIVVEERSADEVRGLVGDSKNILWSMPNSPVFNPVFDVTPADLVTAFILDSGVYKPTEIVQLACKINEQTLDFG
jgi:methylthioribose-1-phosphate isomerase